MGIDPGVSRLGGEIASHNTTDVRHGCVTSSLHGRQRRVDTKAFPVHVRMRCALDEWTRAAITNDTPPPLPAHVRARRVFHECKRIIEIYILKIYKLTQSAGLRSLVAAEKAATKINNLVLYAFLCICAF